MSVRSSLARHVARPAAGADEMARMRRAVWHQAGVAVLDPASIVDPWLRQAIVNEANRQYGRRPGGR